LTQQLQLSIILLTRFNSRDIPQRVWQTPNQLLRE